MSDKRFDILEHPAARLEVTDTSTGETYVADDLVLLRGGGMLGRHHELMVFDAKHERVLGFLTVRDPEAR